MSEYDNQTVATLVEHVGQDASEALSVLHYEATEGKRRKGLVTALAPIVGASDPSLPRWAKQRRMRATDDGTRAHFQVSASSERMLRKAVGDKATDEILSGGRKGGNTTRITPDARKLASMVETFAEAARSKAISQRERQRACKLYFMASVQADALTEALATTSDASEQEEATEAVA